MNNKSASFVDLIYEIAPESRYWANIVSDLETIALENFKSIAEKNNQFASPLPVDRITKQEKKTLQAILPHLQRVLSIQKKLVHLEQQKELATSLLESMPIGVIIVNSENEIVSFNRVADRMLQKSQIIERENNLFSLENILFTDYLCKIKRTLRNINEASIYQVIKNSNEEVSVLITAAKTENHFIVFLSDDKGREYVSRESLQKIFPVSVTEADLCISLISGESFEEIAQKRKTSVQTIRTQFKNIFRKTRSNGQVQLVRKILTSLARFNTADYETLETPVLQTMPLSKINQTMRLPDGRALGFAEYGNENGFPLIFCHSLFGSRHEYPSHHPDENERNFRIIIPERPGYGLSTFAEGCNYVNWVKDLTALLDHLEIDRFAIAGLSSGAIYAAAVASALPSRVVHLSAISMTPRLESWQDLKHVASNLKFFGAFSIYMPHVAKFLFEKEAQRLQGNTAKIVQRITEAEEDRALLFSEQVFPVIEANFQESIKNSLEHLSNEVIIHAQPWQFSFADIQCPMDIWCGERDLYAPPALVDRNVQSVVDRQMHTMTGKGHFFYYELWPQIGQTIAQRMETSHEVVA